jgi:hypothetical protein
MPFVTPGTVGNLSDVDCRALFLAALSEADLRIPEALLIRLDFPVGSKKRKRGEETVYKRLGELCTIVFTRFIRPALAKDQATERALPDAPEIDNSDDSSVVEIEGLPQHLLAQPVALSPIPVAGQNGADSGLDLSSTSSLSSDSLLPSMSASGSRDSPSASLDESSAIDSPLGLHELFEALGTSNPDEVDHALEISAAVLGGSGDSDDEVGSEEIVEDSGSWP